MNAKDLRIGNWINTSYFVTCVTEITETTVYDGFIYYLIENTSGIPINTEWLLRLGFKATVGEGLRLTIPLNEYVVLNYESGDFFMSGNNDEHTTIVVGIEEVHKLQNFYFDNTGKDMALVEE